MATYRTYSNNDIVEGETTLTAAQKTNQRFADVLSWFPVTTGAAQHMVMTLASGLAGFVFTHILRSNVPLNHTGGNGTANQFLMGDGSGGTTWNHAVRSDASVSLTGANSLAQGDILYFNGTVLTRLGAGTAGQLLVTNGTGANPNWVTLSADSAWSAQTSNFNAADNGRYILNNSGILTITLSASPTVGQQFYFVNGSGDFAVNNITLNRNGSNIEGAAANQTISKNGLYRLLFVGGTVGWNVIAEEAIDQLQTTVKTSNYTAANREIVPCDTTSASFTLTLPASPSTNSSVTIYDYAGTFGSRPLTIGRNLSKINGLNEDMTCYIPNACYKFMYIDSTQGWKVLRGV